jgi:hypothetical protein
MGPLTVFCPNSRRSIASGIETDWPTIVRLGRLTVRVVCPDCGENHDLRVSDGYVARAEIVREAHSTSPRLERLLSLAQSALSGSVRSYRK